MKRGPVGVRGLTRSQQAREALDFYISVRGTDTEEITAYWTALVEPGRSAHGSLPPATRRCTGWPPTASA
ncbi:hypothetical protein [Blastococcus sp. SYSU DS0619]